MASMSWFVGRRSVICSMSGVSQGANRWSGWARELVGKERTCDVLIQDGVFLDHIVDEAATVWVDNQHFPLQSVISTRTCIAIGQMDVRRRE